MTATRLLSGPDGDSPRLGYGADYNPEQWPREVWEEDVRLMREAGVTVVSVGIFSWARIQSAPDAWDFAWLDEVMDLLHEGGIGVDLATATASPPHWLTTAHPEILPVTATGETLWPGRGSIGAPSHRCSGSTRSAWCGRWPSATPVTRPWSPGTSPTSWAATTSTTTPRTRPAPSATGCAPAT